MWYGIVVDGKLTAVQEFDRSPFITDFHIGFFTTQSNYEIVEVDVVITGKVDLGE